MDRRKFLVQSGLTGTALMAAPSLFSNHISAGSRKLLLVILSGGVRASDFAQVWDEQNAENIVQHYTLSTGIELKSKQITHHSGHREIYHQLHSLPQSHKIRAHFPSSPFVAPVKSLIADTYSRTYRAPGTLREGLTVWHVEGFDRAHSDFEGYKSHLSHSVKQLISGWNSVQNNPVERDNTMMIITSDIGRNNFHNEMGGLDHHDESARELFALTLSPAPLRASGSLTATVSDWIKS